MEILQFLWVNILQHNGDRKKYTEQRYSGIALNVNCVSINSLECLLKPCVHISRK